MMQNIHFIDFETAPQHNVLGSLMDGQIPDSFKRKFKYQYDTNSIHPANSWVNIYLQHAGLFAEWGKIISASIGVLVGNTFFIKTITSTDEIYILEEFAKALNPNEPKKPSATTLAGHNIKEFDVPIAMRRYLINRLPLPEILNTMGKKEYNLPFIDTMQLWGGTQWKYMTSLDTLCDILGIEPKQQDDIIKNGAHIAEVYYSITDETKAGILQRIGVYNAGDVLAAARLYARLKGLPTIKSENVIYIQI